VLGGDIRHLPDAELIDSSTARSRVFDGVATKSVSAPDGNAFCGSRTGAGASPGLLPDAESVFVLA